MIIKVAGFFEAIHYHHLCVFISARSSDHEHLFFDYTPISILFSFWWHSCSFLSGLASLAIICRTKAQFCHASYMFPPSPSDFSSPKPTSYLCMLEQYLLFC